MSKLDELTMSYRTLPKEQFHKTIGTKSGLFLVTF